MLLSSSLLARLALVGACIALAACDSGEKSADAIEDAWTLPGVPSDYASRQLERATLLGIDDPPDVVPVRSVSREEYYRVQQQCLLEQGFRTELNADGDELTVHLADGQAEGYYLADFVCGGMFPLHEAYTTGFDLDQLRVYYEWNSGPLSDCMKSAGYAVSPPPTFETFTAMFDAGKGMWTPFDDVPEELWLSTVTDVAHQCELEPADKDVYGDVG